MTDLLLIIDRLLAVVPKERWDDPEEIPVHADPDDVAALVDQLVYWVQRTATIQGRDLLTASPPDHLNLPSAQFDVGTPLRVAEAYADDFYPAEWGELRLELLALTPEERVARLRSRFIEWLHKQWQEEATVPLPHQVPPKAAEEDLLAYTPEMEENERREVLKENLRRFLDPLTAWRERNQHLPLWQPACNLLHSTGCRLEVVPLKQDRQRLLVPSQAEIDDCWFRALYVVVCRNLEASRSQSLSIRQLAGIIGIDSDRVDYLIRLEKKFQSDLRKS